MLFFKIFLENNGLPILHSGMNWTRSRNPPPMMRKEERRALLGQFLRSRVDMTWAGTSVQADRKQFM